MPNYFNPNPYGYQFQPPVIQQSQPQQQMQIQNGGFVSVRNEMEARNYPVALGNSVTFKDENAPYVYTKTMGFSQLDVPKFEKYKLVKETPEEPSQLLRDNMVEDDVIDGLKSEIKALWDEIEGIKNDRSKSDAPSKRTTKREKDGDD